jgi:hypothetical protein
MTRRPYSFVVVESARHYRRSRQFHSRRPLVFQGRFKLGRSTGPRQWLAVSALAAVAASAGATADPHAAKAVIHTAIPATRPAPTSCRHPGAGGDPGSNQALGGLLAGCLDGWTGQQTSCLDQLWHRESGWSNTADTRKTHTGGDGPGSYVFAYGIAQARPATKYPSAGRPPDLGGRSDPATQIRWGLADIRTVYDTPCAALGHENTHGWY